MPGPITYAAVALLARDRIAQIRRALQAKKDAGTAKELELHVLFLATQAERMMSATQPVIEAPRHLYSPPLTDHVSRFTLLGAVGPDLPRYAAYFVPGQRWLFDTLHKGTPDEHREKVLVGSTDLVFDFWRRVGTHIDIDTSNEDKRKEAKEKMQAYVLGHLCHVATDVLVHPYFETLETRLSVPAVGPNPGIRLMRRDDVAGALDVRVSDTFFGRGTDTRNRAWADWFPTTGDVPNAFAKAMTESIAALYSARAEGLPQFEDAFKAIDPAPPELSAGLIDESVSYFRTIMEIERVWTLADWLGATAAMFLPMAFAYFGALVLPQGKDLDKTLTAADGADAEAQRTYESIAFPLMASSLGPLVSMIIVSASGRELRAEGVTGWIQAGLSLAASIGFFASLGGAGGARWTLFFALPLLLAVVQIAFVIARGATENSRKLLFLGPLVQVLLALLFMLLYRVWLHDGVEELQKKSDERDNGQAFGFFAAWLAIVLVLWIVHAILWRYAFSASVADDQDSLTPSEPRKFLRLYDDMGLIHDFNASGTSEKLKDLAYPPARRAILKMWWEGTGGITAQLLSNRDRLVFKFSSPTVLDVTVFAPVAPITIEKWGSLLEIAVNGDGSNGHLHVKPFRDDEKTIELAPGALFADNGDDKTVLSEHDAAALVPTPIGATEAAAITLFHAPRPRLAGQMGRTGAVPDPIRREQASKANAVLKPHPTIARRYQASVPDTSSPLLHQLFAPGDIIEIASGGPPGEQRIVEEVIGETDLLVASSFAFAIPMPAGVGFKRAASSRVAAVPGATNILVPAVQPGVLPNDVQATAAQPFFFAATLKVGDTIEIKTVPKPQRRVITAIKDAVTIGTPPVVASLITLDAVLAPVPAAPVAFERIAAEEEFGLTVIADPDDVFGDSGPIMNDAADLAALLCIGAASRIQFAPPPAGEAPATPVNRVSQVFRNWNLDRRRVNEWKMMVSGGASSERRGDFSVVDETVSVDPAAVSPSAALQIKHAAGEATANALGWLSTFRSWVDVASHPSTDTTANVVFRPGAPSNRDLTRAMGYLLDATETAVP